MPPIHFDLPTLRAGYLARQFTVSDILREALARIRAGDPKIWIAIETEDRLLAQAAALETQDPTDLPLYGIPFSVKDNIDVAGLPTTAACPDYRYFAQADATVVAHLRAAGAIPLGKTNLDQFATGLVGTRSPYGVPANPYHPDYIPGGSSSGSAVSVAAGQAAFSLGTDTAGSGRVPACYNNLVGLKPTRGLLSATGLVPACKSLDCISIFAHTAPDAQAILQVAARHDPADPYSRPQPQNPNLKSEISNHPSSPQLLFGIPRPHQLQFFGDTEYQELYLAAIRRLETLGYQSRPIDFSPFLAAARLLYEGPWVAERYWAIQDLIKTSPDSLHPVTRAIIEKGAHPTAVQAFAAAYQLQAHRQATLPLWDQLDFLATPTAGTHYTIAQVQADPIQLNTNLGYYTNYLNLLDLAAVATPTGFTPTKKLPFGITLVAPAFQDQKLLAIATHLHQSAFPPITDHRSPITDLPPAAPTPLNPSPVGSGLAPRSTQPPTPPRITERPICPPESPSAPPSSPSVPFVPSVVKTLSPSASSAVNTTPSPITDLRSPITDLPPAAPALPIAVCGAHMSGLPLNHQLTALGATLDRPARTSPRYRLFALAGTTPPKPGLLRDPARGDTIDLEIWNLPAHQWGAFIAQIPPPLGIANIELADGTHVKGFACESHAIAHATDITHHHSWRAYLAQT